MTKDYIQELLEEVTEDLKKQKEEAKMLMEELTDEAEEQFGWIKIFERYT